MTALALAEWTVPPIRPEVDRVLAGVSGAPETLRIAGRHHGLTALASVWQIPIPAALPAILSGLKIGGP